MEEHKPVDIDSDVEENNNSFAFDPQTAVPVPDVTRPSPLMEDIIEEAESERPSSISDFDRPSSVRSGSFFQEPSFDSDSARGSLASSSLSGVSRPRDESLGDPFRSREDSYADSTRSRGDSYADSTRSRNDSYADVFNRSRDNSYDDVFRSRGDSYADVPSKSDFDEHNLSDEETHDGPKYFDTDSERGSLISDSPVSGKNTSDNEKREQHEEEQATPKKSGSRWRATSVLSALSSRRSSKPTSSPTSSIEDDDKDVDPKTARTSTLPSVAASGLSSVAGLLNRKLSVPASNTSSTKSFEDEIEESFVYSPPAQQTKNKSRFGRFTAPAITKPALSSRFAWKSRSRRGTNDEEDEDHAVTHAA
ncbi:hypothetical protein PHMEG_00016761 [Phytophthora megakarya]|uniref:Uncharacterized protein n=1 Tax=Phytophthora megakarya TaxID=4795 RepID=A0A225VYF9_9STRA|nr:hypothetical protein PHMEG_00016761 [Phytophthora megakarya]